jgi:hypothetical protein
MRGWGRQRRSSRHDAAALLLLVGIAAIAALGAYLLVVGAIALIAWLARVAMRSHPVATSPATVPTAPRSEYRCLGEVGPNVFEDAARHRVAASSVFNAWLRGLPKAPRSGIDLVREVTLHKRLIGRLTSDVEGRRFAWRASPALPRQPLGTMPLDPARLDPWNPPHDLERSSHYVTTCFTCHGDGRVNCRSCGGGGRTQCSACKGDGKFYGRAANGAYRMLNCKACRGKGDLKCDDCTRGRVECGTCAKAKKVECWLAIETWTRHDAQVEPDGAVTKAFTWGQDGVEATSDAIALDARCIDAFTRQRAITIDELPISVPIEWRDHWPRLQAKLASGERIKAQTFALLDVPSTHVTYALHDEQQIVAFEGLRLLAPPPTDDLLFAKRSRMLGRLQLVLAALPIGVAVIYGARGAYFATARPLPFVSGVVLAAAVVGALAYTVVWNATLGRRTARTWAFAAIAPTLTALVLAWLAEPTVSRARDYIEASNLIAAVDELDGLGSPDSDEHASLWADVHLKQALAASSCIDAASVAKLIPASMPQHVRATAGADALALTAAQRALDAGHLGDVESSLSCASPAFREAVAAKSVRGLAALANGNGCLTSKSWDCALTQAGDATRLGAPGAAALTDQTMAAIRAELDVDVVAARKEKNLAQRTSRESAALGLWTKYLATSGKELPAISALKAAKARDDAAYARQLEVERRHDEAAERARVAAVERDDRQRIAAAKREEERQAAATAAAFSGALMCNDGSESPSCSCGGSHRGCCSHHGGVAGCR